MSAKFSLSHRLNSLSQFFIFLSQIKPLHEKYINEVSSMIWEQLNRFWAESYEACKSSSQKRNKNLMESRRKFQVGTHIFFSNIDPTELNCNV